MGVGVAGLKLQTVGEALVETELQRIVVGSADGGDHTHAGEVVQAVGVRITIERMRGVIPALLIPKSCGGERAGAGRSGEAGVVSGLGLGISFDDGLVVAAKGADVAHACDGAPGKFTFDGELNVLRVWRAERWVVLAQGEGRVGCEIG